MSLHSVTVKTNFSSIVIESAAYSQKQQMNIELPKGLLDNIDEKELIYNIERCIVSYCYNNEIQPDEIFLVRDFFIVKSAIYLKITEIFPEYFF